MTVCFCCGRAITDDDPATVATDGMAHDYCLYDSEEAPPLSHLHAADSAIYSCDLDIFGDRPYL
jgi:hypothetical protein